MNTHCFTFKRVSDDSAVGTNSTLKPAYDNYNLTQAVQNI